MKNRSYVATGVCGFVIFFAPLVFADTPSVSIQSLTPGPTVFARNTIGFDVMTSGFSAQVYYTVSDSFNGSTVSASNISPVGKFSWTPGVSDVGTHTLTITASDYVGDKEIVTQTITVAPPPSISIQSVSPGNKIMPGTAFSFTVSPVGFTDPAYSVNDSLHSSAGNVIINSSGNFSWTPDMSDKGEHTITVYAYDSLGHSNYASVNVQVGEGPTLTISSVSPSTSVVPGQAVSFIASPMNFFPSAFSVVDNFAGTTISNNNINTTGAFSWAPLPGDVGTHVITVTGIVGAYGKSASTTQTITVLGPGGVAPTGAVLGVSTSTASSDATVSALQAQLAELNAKIAIQTSTSVAAIPPSGSTFNTYLYRGMDGDEVKKLQTTLSQQGFFSGEANGHFGPLTEAAVKKFQAAHGLDQRGVVGPATRVALNALPQGSVAGVRTTASDGYVFENFIGRGDHGTDVLELQKRLISLGLLEGDATGYFGAMTEAAVKKFQTAHNIDAKGWVGPGTRAALNQ